MNKLVVFELNLEHGLVQLTVKLAVNRVENILMTVQIFLISSLSISSSLSVFLI